MDKIAINNRFITSVNTLSINKKDIAEGLGIKNSTFSEILSGRMNVATDHLANLSEKFGFSESWLLTGDGNMLKEKSSYGGAKPPPQVKEECAPAYKKRKKIPFYDGMRVAGELSGTKEPTGYIDAGDWFHDATAAMRVYGKSMAPDYNAGSIAALRLVCNTSLIVYGQDYVIETDEFRIIKRIQKTDLPDHILCCSVNQERYENSKKLRNESFDVPISEIRRLFRVVGCINRNESSGILLTSHE